MDFLSLVLTTLVTSILFLFIFFSILIFKIFLGKSIRSSLYPPVMGTVFDLLFYFNRLYDYETDVARKHRTFCLLAFSHSELYTTDPRNIEHVLKTNFDSYSKGQYKYDIASDLFGDGIFAVDGDKWRLQRKLASFEFSTRVLRDFSCAVFRRNAAKLAKTIMEFAIANHAFDIQDLLMKCTLDSIFRVGFGADLDCLGGTSEGGKEFIKALDDSNVLIYWGYIDLFWKVKRYLNIGSEAVLRKKINLIDDFVYGLIDRKRKQLSGQGDLNNKEDILSRFLVAGEKDPTTITNQYLRDIILNFIIAGKDSTATTLSWFFFMLCKHPLVQEKITEEVREAVDGTSIDNFVANLTDEVLDKMQYLHAALTETLRLYPAIPVDGKSSEINDVLPDGFRVTKGDGVCYMAYAMGRMNYIWGDDAEDFRPDRWLHNGVFRPEPPSKFIAFHAGPQICLGKESAYREMKIITMVLLQFFKFKLHDENKQAKYRTMATLHIDGGLHLHALSRFN